MLDFIIRAVVCFFIVGVISRNAFRGTYLPAFKKRYYILYCFISVVICCFLIL